MNTTHHGRWRVIVIRACVAISFACLLALVIFAPLRHGSLAGGIVIAVTATVSIVSGLLYLRSRR